MEGEGVGKWTFRYEGVSLVGGDRVLASIPLMPLN